MKRVLYSHMMAIDTAYHVVFFHEGKLGHVRMPMGGIFSMSLAESPTKDLLQVEIEKLVGEPVRLEQRADWANIRDEHGLVDHPFMDQRMKLRALTLTYSNWFDAQWYRWFPEEEEREMQRLMGKIRRLESELKVEQDALNLITSKDYSDLKPKVRP